MSSQALPRKRRADHRAHRAGCGAALAAPSALSLLATTFPAGPARTRALGVYGSMAGLGSVIGLVLGGTLTEYASWRWVLFINAPIAVAVLAATFTGVLVPGDRERGTLDVPGAITTTLGIASLIYALTRGNTNGWADAGTLTAFALGAVLLPAFATAERFSRAPMLPAGVIRDRNRAGANAVMLLLGAGLLAMYYLLTLYLQLVRGYSALHTGLAYLPNVVGLGALAAIASAVTRSQQAGHTHAAAPTNGYVAGLLTGATIYAAGAIVAALAINARLGPGELAGHRAPAGPLP